MLQLYYNRFTKENLVKNVKITHVLSIIAMVITLVGIAYAGIAMTWGLPYGPQIYDTAVILTASISALLGGTTIKKFTDNNHNGIPDSEEEGLVEEPVTIEEDGKVDEFSEEN